MSESSSLHIPTQCKIVLSWQWLSTKYLSYCSLNSTNKWIALVLMTRYFFLFYTLRCSFNSIDYDDAKKIYISLHVRGESNISAKGNRLTSYRSYELIRNCQMSYPFFLYVIIWRSVANYFVRNAEIYLTFIILVSQHFH